MSPHTEALLRAVAALVNHAQARPLDGDGLGKLRAARGRAEVAWVQAGSPDLPAGVGRPSVVPAALVLPRNDGDDKDWTRVPVECELLATTERALLLDAGEGRFWCPRSVVDGAEALVVKGDVAEVMIPRWLLP